jgi:hypothetical protein
VAFSPLANYTDCATATSRRILMPTFVDRGGGGVSRGQRGGTLTVVNLSFLDQSHYFFLQVAPHLCSRGRVDPVPDPLLLRNSGSADNRTRDLCDCSRKLWPLDHRGGHHQGEGVQYYILKIEVEIASETFILGFQIKKNQLPVVRKRTIPTERPPLVDKILVPTFVDRGVSRRQRGGSPTVVNLTAS